MSLAPPPISLQKRRQALCLGHVNAALWATGNALTTGPLVSYLARDLGAAGSGAGTATGAAESGGRGAAGGAGRHLSCRHGPASVSVDLLASYLLIVGLPAIVLAAPTISRPTAVVGDDRAVVRPPVARVPGHRGAVVVVGRSGADADSWALFRAAANRAVAVSIPTLLAGGYFADRWRETYRDQPRHAAVGVRYSRRRWARPCCWRRWCRWR